MITKEYPIDPRKDDAADAFRFRQMQDASSNWFQDTAVSAQFIGRLREHCDKEWPLPDLTVPDNTEREAFEKVCPVPEGLHWSSVDSDYAVDHDLINYGLQHEYRSLWQGFQLGRAQDADRKDWVLVPREPTKEMLVAGVKDRYGPATYKVTLAAVEEQEVAETYKAMIAAISGSKT